MNVLLDYALLIILVSMQQFSHTWSSRSRNSGDPKHHLLAAVFSNGIWIVSWTFITGKLFETYTSGSILGFIPFAVVYTATASWASAGGMSYLLKRESGSRRVGANPHDDD